jgi:septal ring factor EnvC (AmiA/AmiB activator)
MPMALIRGDFEQKDIPFLRRISADPDPFVDQTDYFRRKQIVQNTVAEYKSFEGALQRERRNEFKDRYREILRMETRMKNADKQLKRLRERRRHQENKIPKDSADALDIADRIEKIEDQMDSIYKKFNKRYNEKVGRFN